MPTFSIYWVTILLSLLIVFLIAYVKLADKRHIDRDIGSHEFSPGLCRVAGEDCYQRISQKGVLYMYGGV